MLLFLLLLPAGLDADLAAAQAGLRSHKLCAMRTCTPTALHAQHFVKHPLPASALLSLLPLFALAGLLAD